MLPAYKFNHLLLNCFLVNTVFSLSLRCSPNPALFLLCSLLRAPSRAAYCCTLEVNLFSIHFKNIYQFYSVEGLDSEVCGELLYVEDEIVIDLSLYGNCDLKIETDEDHILAFSLVDGQFEDIQEYLAVRHFTWLLVFSVFYLVLNLSRFTMVSTKTPLSF